MKRRFRGRWKVASPSEVDVRTTSGRDMRGAFMLMMCIFTSCSLFEVRDPEEPVVLRSTFEPPTEPLIVLENLKSAFRERHENNYLRCLADSVTGGRLEFVPTPEASSRYGVFLAWDKSSEREYFLNMNSRLPAGSSLALILGTPVMQGTTSDSVQVDVSYDLSVPTGQQALPNRGQGRAVFTMILDRSTGTWSIRSWHDFSVDLSTSSWSDIKGAFAQ